MCERGEGENVSCGFLRMLWKKQNLSAFLTTLNCLALALRGKVSFQVACSRLYLSNCGMGGRIARPGAAVS